MLRWSYDILIKTKYSKKGVKFLTKLGIYNVSTALVSSSGDYIIWYYLGKGWRVCLLSLVLIAGTSPQKSISARREQVAFRMAIGNGELMHECFPKHQRMGTASQKLDNETEEESKKRRINVERSTADTKERSPVQSPCRVVTSVTHDSQSSAGE